MDKMNVITFAKTGHVLGVVTRASQPETAVTPVEVAAGGFILGYTNSGGENINLLIPEDEIGVALVDYDTRILYQPHLFAVVDGEAVVQMDETDGLNPLAINITNEDIEVSVPIPVNNPYIVRCEVSGGALSEPVVRSVKIDGSNASPKFEDSEPFPLSNSTDAYKVAMFAPGYISVVASITLN